MSRKSHLDTSGIIHYVIIRGVERRPHVGKRVHTMANKDRLNKTDFDKKAATWDEDPFKVNLANDVAGAIVKELNPVPSMDVLDYGCGSGLVTLRLQPLVKSITAMDSSKKMLEVLQTKVEKRGLTNVHTQLIDLEQGAKVKTWFHVVVSEYDAAPRPGAGFFLRSIVRSPASWWTDCYCRSRQRRRYFPS